MAVNNTKLKSFIEVSFSSSTDTFGSESQVSKREKFVISEIIRKFLKDSKTEKSKIDTALRLAEAEDGTLDKINRWIAEQEEKFQKRMLDVRIVEEMTRRKDKKDGFRDKFDKKIVRDFASNRSTVETRDSLDDALNKVLRDPGTKKKVKTSISKLFDERYRKYFSAAKKFVKSGSGRASEVDTALASDLDTDAGNIATEILKSNLEFDRRKPASWDVNDVQIHDKIRGDFNSLDSVERKRIEKKLGSCALNPEHGSSVQTDNPYHTHVCDGSKGVSFYYKHEGGCKVTPWLYDIANTRSNNKYNWERGGKKQSGPSSMTP